MNDLQTLLKNYLEYKYKQLQNAKTDYQRRNSLRDAAVIEMLFATGIRISELCSLKMENVNLYDKSILIFGKGSKERKLQIHIPCCYRPAYYTAHVPPHLCYQSFGGRC